MRAHSLLAVLVFGMSATAQVESVSSPRGPGNQFYPGNRAPLQPSPFVKLPIGNIRPEGWLRGQLELARDGMIGRLQEISPWLDFSKSSWANREGTGRFGWEEMPYWLKGYGDLGYVLNDAAIVAEARKWIEAAMASQRDDGWFGPRELLTSLNGKPDLWPHMVMLNVLQSYHERTGDPRVITLMTRYMRWQNNLPVSAFGEGYWPRIRAGDNIESVLWLYNRTGERWLLDLADKIHQGMARWDQDIINWHNVNLAQGFRAGTVYWMRSGQPDHLSSAERNYTRLMALYGQFPGGGFVGDENCRPGFVDPRGGIETCGIVEFTHSFQMLLRITGQSVWADRCEEIAFNNLPAALTPDLKGLHYITCANQVQLDRANKAPGIQNGGTMFSYSPYEVYRCCQHNVSHGWPYYAEELWLGTADNGLGAALYAACSVEARVGSGTTVTLAETTDYPFGETIRLKLSTPQPVTFPLYLRVPAWCDAPGLTINGEAASVPAKAGGFLVIRRLWANGDLVTLDLPMRIKVRRWPANQHAVSVDHGPLSYSLAIKERWAPYGARKPGWPEWEVFPASAWNYGLVLDPREPERSFTVHRASQPLARQPFTPDTVPVKLTARGRKIPPWQLDRLGMVDKLQPSPVQSSEPVEEITLIPMGAARLRLSMFPTIANGAGGHVWVAPPRPKPSPYQASASHCFENDTVDALGDGLELANSGDGTIPRFTWWPRRGSTEWVQYDFGKPLRVSSVAVYWFDDTGVGQCRVPRDWRLLRKSGEAWVEATPRTKDTPGKNRFDRLSFEPVETSALRLEVELQPGFSGGILEWQVR